MRVVHTLPDFILTQNENFGIQFTIWKLKKVLFGHVRLVRLKMIPKPATDVRCAKRRKVRLDANHLCLSIVARHK